MSVTDIRFIGYALPDVEGDDEPFVVRLRHAADRRVHVAYDMANVDEMMRGIAKLKRNNIDIGWGPGRHTAGNNAFSYFLTPAAAEG